MRCPECGLAVNANTDQCPWCNAFITPIDDPMEVCTPVKPAVVYVNQGSIHFWIWLGNLFTAGLGGFLIALALSGIAAWGLAVGIILIALAAISLVASWFGTRWDGLPAGRKLFIWLSVLGDAAIVAIVFPIATLVVAVLIVKMLPALDASRSRPLWSTERRRSPSPLCPICGDPIAPGDKKCARCGK